MTDPATIEQRIRSENPWFPVSEGSASYTVSPDELPEIYEAMIADRVAMTLSAEAEAAEETQQRTRRQQFITGMTVLRADWAKLDDETQTVSQLEFRRMLKRCVRGVLLLGEIMQDLRQLEREGG
jgi:hypothetical protein